MVKPAVEYRRNPPPGEPDDPTETLLLVQVDAEGRANEGFRFPIAGGTLECDLWGNDIFEDEDLCLYRIRYEIEAGRIDIKPNAYSSKWEDLSELLARGVLVAYHGHEKTEKTREIREILERKHKEDPNFGTSLRWNVQAKNKDELSLVLQALPRPAGFLRRDARLNTDRCTAVELARLPLETSMQTEGPCRGPLPILFSRNPEATEASLAKDPGNLYPGENMKI